MQIDATTLIWSTVVALLVGVLITLLLGLALALKASISETAEAVIRTLVALVNVGMLFFFSHHIIYEWRRKYGLFVRNLPCCRKAAQEQKQEWRHGLATIDNPMVSQRADSFGSSEPTVRQRNDTDISAAGNGDESVTAPPAVQDAAPAVDAAPHEPETVGAARRIARSIV